jgi:hypothetical protein
MTGLARFGFVATLAAGLALAATSASAAGWGGGPGGPGYGGHGGNGGYRGFGPGAAFALRAFAPGWTGGHWVHGWHGPQQGWWWNVGSAWYLYSRPSYPYPAYLPGSDYGVPGDAGNTYYPAQAYSGYGLSTNADSAYSAPTIPADPQSYVRYYCTSAQRYYPEVLDCDQWQPVDFGPLDPSLLQYNER